MRKFWRWLEKLASDQLAKNEMKDSWIGVKNEFHALHGAIGAAWEANGELLTQRLRDYITPKLNDYGVIIRDKFDAHEEVMKRYTDRGIGLVSSICGRVFEAIELLSRKSEKRQNVVMQSFEEIARQAAIHDQSNTDRSLAIHESLRQLATKLDLSQGMQVKFFENLTEQLAELKTPREKQRFDSAPTLQWLFDNIEAIANFGKTFELVRDNHIPKSAAKMELIRSIRAINLYSISNIHDEVGRLMQALENDTQLQAA
jgi:hypothetical protein